MDAAARPLPSEDTTPPVTKIYFADIATSYEIVFGFCAVADRGARPIIQTSRLIQKAKVVRPSFRVADHSPRIVSRHRLGSNRYRWSDCRRLPLRPAGSKCEVE